MLSKPWHEIEERLAAMQFAETFDLIVAVANGGTVPAALLQQKLQVPMELLKINFRNTSHQPLFEQPQLLQPVHFDVKGKTILLVEDRVKTGASLNFAKSLLEKEAALVKTFAVNGPADYPLYNEQCFTFPWIMKRK